MKKTLIKNKPDSIVFIGHSPIINKLFDINKKKGIKSFLITSPDQSKKLKEKIDHKVFERLNKKFEKFIKDNFSLEKTLFISISSRWIFNKRNIKFFKNRLLNFHSSRLPYFKGGATFSWQILCGDRIHSTCLHLVDKTVDGGPIVFSQQSIFPSHCKTPKDYQDYDLCQLYICYEKFLKKILKKEHFTLKHQPKYIGNYFPRLSTLKDSWIDWEMNPDDVIKFINAFDTPFKGSGTCLTRFNKKKFFIKKAHLHEGEISKHPLMTGLVIRNDKNWIVVALSSKSHTLLIEKVNNIKGNNILSKIKAGDRFFTPHKFIESSRIKRTKIGIFGNKKK